MPEIWNQNESKFTLTSGREVELTSLRFRMTYEGILEGTPGPKMNQFVLDHLDPPEPWRSTAVAIDTPKDLSGSLPSGYALGSLSLGREFKLPKPLPNSITSGLSIAPMCPPYERS